MIKFFAKRRHRKGFTLTETIVVVALLAIIIACVVAFGSPVRAMVKNSSAKNDSLTINKIIGDYVERQLSFANKMDILIGYDYSVDDGPMKDAFEKYRDMKKSNKTPGVLIFHYDNYYGSKSVRVFNYFFPDLPAEDSSDLPISSLPSLNYIGSDTPSGATGDYLKDYAIFDDAFYADYEYFMTIDDTLVTTNAANKAFITFSIDSYDTEDDQGIEERAITNYYKGIATGSPVDFGKGTTADETNAIHVDYVSSALTSDKSSFAIENIKGKTELKYNDTEDRFDPVTTPPSLTINRNSDPITVSGTDVFVFYNIERFEY